LGDQAIETTHLLDVMGVHSLTLVREVMRDNYELVQVCVA
jgi:hypothetical protein